MLAFKKASEDRKKYYVLGSAELDRSKTTIQTPPKRVLELSVRSDSNGNT
jgi:hypothetical protein